MNPGVVSRSRSLAERLARPSGAEAGESGASEREPTPAQALSRARESMRRWSDACARGDEALFARRLELAGASEDEATARLARSFRDDGLEVAAGDASDAEWIRVLLEATATRRPVVESFVRVARLRLERRRSSILERRLSASALEDLLAILRERLAERVARIPEWGEAPLEAPAIPEEAPVLARDLARESVQWIEFAADFLQRLDEDADAIAGFGDDHEASRDPNAWHGRPARASIPETPSASRRTPEDTGRMPVPRTRERPSRLCTAIEGELSDRHRGGRTVLVVRFETGPPVVFKPRDLGLEAAFHRLVGDLARMGAPPLPSPARVLIRPGGGWMEHVAREDCPDLEAARRHFRKAGALVALAYLLVGSDLHFENLVARGEDPVPVDLEMLLRPRPPAPGAASPAPIAHDLDAARREARRRRSESVESTGLLPRIGPARKGVPEASGFFAGDPPTTDVPPHRAALGGVPLAPSDFADEMEAGLRAMFEFALRERDRLLAADGPLEPLRRVVPRFAFRRSSLYAALLAESRDPAMLADGFERSLGFERLGRAVLDRPDWRVAGRMFLEEIAALERGDVPRFGVAPEAASEGGAFDAEFARTFDGIPLGAVDPENPPASKASRPLNRLPFFVESGWSRMRGRFASLSPREIDRQAEVLRASLRMSRGPGEDDTCSR